MRRNRLGTTDLTVSALCLGTMTFGEQNSEADGHAQLDYALDHGIDFVDTAEMYPIPPRPETQGRTEEIIGSWFAARGNRSRVVLATKVNGRSASTWLRDDRSPTRLIRAQVDEAVAKSLKRLRTDWIDLYQVHWPERAVSHFGSNPVIWSNPTPDPDEVPIEETLDALAAHVKAGRIRHIGLSNETSWGTMRWLRAAEIAEAPRVVSIQNAYSLINRTFEINLAELSSRESVGLLAYSPLAQGTLTGKYRGGARPPGSRKALFDRLQRYEKVNTAEAVEAYVALAAELGIDPATLAIAFVASRPFVTATILGATTLDQLKVDVAAIDFTITPEIAARLDAIHLRYPNPAP
ncbi:NADP(H)-dependent aldo-keto reductase [Siculibacillus lacustris]|uniref:Protein tas n=1 Tax=Siculibacillus lacustris TaxID=1549641 RepID=A0A4Q9VXR7_9HYPH|nr:NADP(H)-dependent aldo-keto reductase [Siculibacillus lacustris]TBW39972.1 NADP(H)-dependent aldo-keto reductase [Siculibacillus lacustris]